MDLCSGKSLLLIKSLGKEICHLCSNALNRSDRHRNVELDPILSKGDKCEANKSFTREDTKGITGNERRRE